MNIRFFILILSLLFGVGGFMILIAGENSERQKSSNTSAEKQVIPYKYSSPTDPVRMIFTGDVMLDRYMRKTIKKRGYQHVLSQEIIDFFQKHSLVVINHEGVLSGKTPLKAEPNMVQFTFPDSSVDIFQALGITYANLGNNHSRDFGKKGDRRTRKILEDNNISSYGSAFNSQSLSTIIKKNGYTIGMVSYNDVFPENFEGVLETVRSIRNQVDILIVTTHWGVEYYSGIEKSQQQKAYQIIDAGADIIVGNHPHVVAPIEQYKEGIIFYSLGNFIFDQVFSDAVRKGLLLSISFGEEQTIFRLIPTEISKKFEISFMEREKSQIFLKAIASVSKLPIETYGEIQEGSIHWKGFQKN